VIELLRHLERLAGRPAEARSAQFLQRRQIVQLGWSLPLVLDTYGKRALETLSGVDDGLGNLTLEDSLLRRMAHPELAAGNFRGGDNFKIGDWNESFGFPTHACTRWPRSASSPGRHRSLSARLVPG